MPLSLAAIRNLAVEIAGEEDPALEVLAATNAEGSADYAEITLALHGCAAEPCRVVIGFSRKATDAEIRARIRERLRDHLRSHR
jgi:hypothetical protein